MEAEAGRELIANPSGSPYHRGKGREREAMFAERARAYGAHFAFCNLVGGQDELVFDGHSFVVDPDGEVLARAAQFEEELLVCEVPGGAAGPRCASRSPTSPRSTRRWCSACATTSRKNGFRHVGVALSGGIDSALVALLAVDALGAENVSCVVMPSPHSSAETQEDARAIAANLGAELIEIPIEPTMAGYEEALARRPSATPAPTAAEPEPLPRDPARPSEPDLAAENIQARIRGNLMMALSNKHGWLVLTTGNKSEMSVGYATLYGDMAGGFAVIKDVPKTLVYELVRHRNASAGRELVPGLGARAGALGRAAPRPARRRLAAALRAARPDPRGLRRARPGPRGDGRRRAAGRGRRRGRPHGRPLRVQAPPGARRGSGSRRRRSAATAGCRSRTASAARRSGGRTAIVICARAQRRPSASRTSASQTQVVRPRWRARASDLAWPSVTGRRKLTLIDWPIAAIPSSSTASAVAREQTLSTRVERTPPCSRPNGWRSSSRTSTRAPAWSGIVVEPLGAEQLVEG